MYQISAYDPLKNKLLFQMDSILKQLLFSGSISLFELDIYFLILLYTNFQFVLTKRLSVNRLKQKSAEILGDVIFKRLFEMRIYFTLLVFANLN